MGGVGHRSPLERSSVHGAGSSERVKPGSAAASPCRGGGLNRQWLGNRVTPIITVVLRYLSVDLTACNPWLAIGSGRPVGCVVGQNPENGDEIAWQMPRPRHQSRHPFVWGPTAPACPTGEHCKVAIKMQCIDPRVLDKRRVHHVAASDRPAKLFYWEALT